MQRVWDASQQAENAQIHRGGSERFSHMARHKHCLPVVERNTYNDPQMIDLSLFLLGSWYQKIQEYELDNWSSYCINPNRAKRWNKSKKPSKYSTHNEANNTNHKVILEEKANGSFTVRILVEQASDG